jgi:transposase
MTVDLAKVKIFIRPGYTDLRKAVNGLAVIIEQQMEAEVFSGNVYLFCNRDRHLIKAMWWDNSGFWLSQKRLEKEKFPWPETSEAVKELTADELQMLLKGIDFFKAHKKLNYQRVS